MGAFQCMPIVAVCLVGPRCWYASLHTVCKPTRLVFKDIHAFLLLLGTQVCSVPGVLVSNRVLTLLVRFTNHVMLQVHHVGSLYEGLAFSPQLLLFRNIYRKLSPLSKLPTTPLTMAAIMPSVLLSTRTIPFWSIVNHFFLLSLMLFTSSMCAKIAACALWTACWTYSRFWVRQEPGKSSNIILYYVRLYVACKQAWLRRPRNYRPSQTEEVARHALRTVFGYTPRPEPATAETSIFSSVLKGIKQVFIAVSAQCQPAAKCSMATSTDSVPDHTIITIEQYVVLLPSLRMPARNESSLSYMATRLSEYRSSRLGGGVGSSNRNAHAAILHAKYGARRTHSLMKLATAADFCNRYEAEQKAEQERKEAERKRQQLDELRAWGQQFNAEYQRVTARRSVV